MTDYHLKRTLPEKTVVRYCLLLGLLILNMGTSSMATTEINQDAQQLLEQGLDLHKRGVWSEAAITLSKASKLFEQSDDQSKHPLVLLTLAQCLDNLGRSRQALRNLEHAKQLVNSLNQSELVIRIYNTEGNIWLRLGELEKAKFHLERALSQAKQYDQERLLASIYNDLGTMYVREGEYNKAEQTFQTSLNIARDQELTQLTIASAMNLAHLQRQQGDTKKAKKTTDSILPQLSKVPDDSFKAFSYLNVGTLYTEFLEPVEPTSTPFRTGIYASSRIMQGKRGVYSRPSSQKSGVGTSSSEQRVGPEDRPRQIHQAYQTLHRSRDLSRMTKDQRTESFAVGFLGHLYEMEGRSEEGLILTREAIHLAQASSTIDSLYQWHWQAARLKATLGKIDESLKSYQLARASLIPIRRALLSTSLNGHRPFRDRQGALFFENADYLLQKASETHEDQEKQQILTVVQTVIEEFKSAELQDYFQDTCVEAMLEDTTPLDSASLPNTAIIYPIILADRLEILVSIGGRIAQVIQQVSSEDLVVHIEMFLKNLQSRSQNTHLSSSQRLYRWLISPLHELLERNGVETLVFVPDGPLRTIPFAALHNGENYLIENYAIAYTPSLTLTGTRSGGARALTVLGVGLTEAVGDFSPLPYVKQEMEAVQKFFEGTVLLDQEFSAEQFREELSKGTYNIVHLATHASFKRRDHDTFIRARDREITMDQLEEMIGVLKYGAEAPELITFSACETALGDDQAALGLAGSAIKAGAKSALASLWRIDDEATAEMIPEFYRHLQMDKQGNKATALRHAQLKMIESSEFSHPTYWSPFLLIGNWL